MSEEKIKVVQEIQEIQEVEEVQENMNKVLSMNDILGVNDLIVEKLFIPEWKGHVFVRTLTGKERDDIETHMFQSRGKDSTVNFTNLRALMVAHTLVTDETGTKRLFKGKKFDEYVTALGGKSAKALDRIFAKAQELSGMRKDDVEELTKNSEEGQSDDSTSD